MAHDKIAKIVSSHSIDSVEKNSCGRNASVRRQGEKRQVVQTELESLWIVSSISWMQVDGEISRAETGKVKEIRTGNFLQIVFY